MRRFELSESLNWFPEMPEAFYDRYHLGNYSEQRIEQIMWKYLVRRNNCERAWVRILQHMPETLNAKPLDMLELSTAHGAMLEIWRHFGHRVAGTDYDWAKGDAKVQRKRSNKRWQFAELNLLRSKCHENPVADDIEGWPYQPVIESLGLDVTLHDGGKLPYPFADKSFDYVCAYQAIEAYARPERWRAIVDEICRIARRCVVLGFNPPPVAERGDDRILAGCRAAWHDMLCYNRGGFEVDVFQLGETRGGVHPIYVKLQAKASVTRPAGKPAAVPANSHTADAAAAARPVVLDKAKTFRLA